jgi:hypothetical protein
MLKIEKYVTPSPDQWGIIIEGMRNPMNSWGKSDSGRYWDEYDEEYKFTLGDNDHDLMMKLAKAGTDHSKYRRMIPVWVTITAPLYWFKEFDTYKVGTVGNSCSTMHKIHAKEFTLDDFNIDDVVIGREFGADINASDIFKPICEECEYLRLKYLETGDKKYWRTLIQLLPSSYNQKRTVMLNYEVLANIYRSRKNHKLEEWHTFCEWIRNLPYSEIITGE